ncbi:hypothetical protein SEPL_298 [Salmonella phage SE_PL]|nr:hypothetical protein 7t3_0285 [Salmonella phage 7t3]QIG62911.1 hypothetical protein SEPL_298 [Salmonella phage SE_PL]
MSTNQQYKEGYQYFKENGAMDLDLLKQRSPLFRSGYRSAQEEAAKKNNGTFPTTLYDIPRRPENFVPTWNDILAATRRPRMRKLHADHMIPLLNLLIREVEKNCADVTRYSDVLKKVDTAFDIMLQYGYDEGILDERDLKQYDYVPK